MDKVKLTMNTLFAGIGCQERGFENSILFDVDVVNTRKQCLVTQLYTVD